MKLKYAQALVQASKDNDLELELYEGYSGRGMYGDRTSAIVGDFNQLLACVALVSRELEEKDLEDFVRSFINIRQDSMGRSSQVFY